MLARRAASIGRDDDLAISCNAHAELPTGAVGLPASRYLHHVCLHANPPRKHAADPTRPRGGAPAVLQDQHAANRCPVSKALPSSARPGPRTGQVVDID